jgi:hypothetical protein
LLQHRVVRPQLRFGDAAARREDAHHIPFGSAEFDRLADIEPGEFTGGGHTGNDLVATGLIHAPLDDLYIASHGRRGRLDASKRNVGVRAR